jgi:hypothetical protein
LLRQPRFTLIEPWGRDKYRQAGVLFKAETVEAACAELGLNISGLPKGVGSGRITAWLRTP